MKTKYYDVPFIDHSGHTARMIWTNAAPYPPLPPLPSWNFYVTDPTVSPNEFNGTEFQCTIFEDSAYTEKPVRFDVYFLPGASAQECINYYYQELQARGDTTRQIDAVNLASTNENVVKGPDRLPGMVTNYSRSPLDIFRKVLFIHDDRSWGEDGKKWLHRVLFDPVSETEYLESEGEPRPDVESVEVERIRVDKDEGFKKRESGVGDWMFKQSFAAWNNDASSAWWDAQDMSWSSW